MISRTRQTIVHFSSEFELSGVDGPQPAGEYRVDHDEEQIEAASRLAWRRVNAFIHLPAIAEQRPARQMVPVTPADMDALSEFQREQS